MSIHARSLRGRKAAKSVFHTQSCLNNAVQPVIEPLEGRTLLSGEQIGDPTVTDFTDSEQGGFVVRLADQSLVQVGTTGFFGSLEFAFARFNAAGVAVEQKVVPFPVNTTTVGYSLRGVGAATVVDDNPSTPGDETRIIVVGSVTNDANNGDADFLVASFDADGDLDNSFSLDGVAIHNFTTSTNGVHGNDAWAVAIADDGKIVVGGDNNINSAAASFVVARYLTNGELDPTFGRDTAVPGVKAGFESIPFASNSNEALRALAIQADGKILLGGSTTPSPGLIAPVFAIQRYNADGTIDDTFDVDGMVTTEVGDIDAIHALAVDAEGRILAGGGAGVEIAPGLSTFALARYNSDGSLDSGFAGGAGYTVVPYTHPNSGGVIIEGQISDLSIESDGKILAGGSVSFCDDFSPPTTEFPAGFCNTATVVKLAAARYDSAGNLDDGEDTIVDDGFGHDGFVFSQDFANPFGSTLHEVSLAIQTNATTQNQTLVVAGAFLNMDENFVVTSDGFSFSRYDLDVSGGTATPVVPSINGPSSGAEGEELDFTASHTGGGGSTVTFLQHQHRAIGGGGGGGGTPTFSWTVTRNSQTYATGSGVNFSFTPDDNGTYVVSLSASGSTTPATQDVVVSNVAPSDVAISGDAGGVRGFAESFSGSFTDAGTADTHEVRWDFGDGTIIDFHPSTDPGALDVSHTYSSLGTFTVTLTVRDDDLDETSATHEITIAHSGVVDGTLQVGGNDVANDIHIAASGTVTVDGQSIAHSGFSNIHVIAGGGSDLVRINQNMTQPVIAFGGAGADSIKSGAGADILVGGDGNDLLHGRDGRDLLIGGDGEDRLVGNADDDILVAGFTNHDSDITALTAIRAEWTSGRSYGQRSANILNQTVTLPNGATFNPSATRNNGNFFLKPDGVDATVFDDADRDVLTGDAGRDLFLFNNDGAAAGSIRDRITDLAGNEFAADIDFLSEP